MGHDYARATRFLKSQTLMFRLAERDYFISQKMIVSATGYSRTAVGEWARGETVMGGPAIFALAEMKEFPSELLSMLFDGTDRCVVDHCDDDELDTLGEDADAVASEVRRARHPQSPGGVEIVSIEEQRIRSAAAKMRRHAA